MMVMVMMMMMMMMMMMKIKKLKKKKTGGHTHSCIAAVEFGTQGKFALSLLLECVTFYMTLPSCQGFGVQSSGS